jgi:hypothetical protein
VCRYDNKPYIVHRCQAKLFRPEDNAGRRPTRDTRLPMESRVFALFAEAISPPSVPGESASAVFARKYASGDWDAEGGSGSGSRGPMAVEYVERVAGLLRLSYRGKNFVDLGCGDGHVTRLLADMVPDSMVAAVDCYRPHIEWQQQTPDSGILWECLDLIEQRDLLPPAPVALLKDVLMHWPNALIVDWLAWAKTCGKWEWLIITNDRVQEDDDCPLGGYRGLDPAQYPLCEFGPIPVGEYAHKAIVLIDCRKV